MPLKKGKSQKTFESNVKELMTKFERTGHIGGASPKSESQARKQAIAIAYSQKRKRK